MQSLALQGGFPDPVMDAQAVFRGVLDAMARPARVVPLRSTVVPSAPLGRAAGAVVCTLADADTPLWLDAVLREDGAVRDWLGFHTGAPLATAPHEALFAVITDPQSLPALESFAQGTDAYPDRSATLILQLPSLESGPRLTFQGPGIKGSACFSPKGLPADFAVRWRDNGRRFPRGVDLVLTADDALACLPRSARLVTEEG